MTATRATKLKWFTVIQHGAEMRVAAEDYEIDGNGVHFVDNVGTDEAVTHSFASHPVMVVQDRPSARDPESKGETA